MIEDVLAAARRRMRVVFDRFERVVVSVSGGKDSHVAFHLAVAEAEARGRTVEAFFLDQEAEYAGTIEVIEAVMTHPAVVPRWYQVPLRMTNATSHRAVWMTAWGPGEDWMRPKAPGAIHDEPGAPDRFYDFFPWFEGRYEAPAAHIVGLRSRESLNRWRAMAKNPGLDGITWSTRTAEPGSFRFYPLYDWSSGDVWKYLADHGVVYNRIYDRMFARGLPERQMRVSFLVHEQSFRALTAIQELEPDTYQRLLRRLDGTHHAALYGDDDHMFRARTLPAAFPTWRAYRDYLLATTPIPNLDRMTRRMHRQGDDEATCKEHVRQLLVNDWENNVPIRRMKPSKLRECWWDRL